MKLIIPKKQKNISDEVYNHQVRLDDIKTMKFARVREVLGGYSSPEIMELLIDKAIESYYDGKVPDINILPKNLAKKIKEMDKDKLSEMLNG